MNFLNQVVSSSAFMPHGHCFLWLPSLIWLHAISDAIIGAAYLLIPISLVWFYHRRPDIPFRWSLNPYRGCQHACTYCFARGSHEHLGYDAGRDFESRIIVKVNAPEMLRQDLGRPGWGRELIGIGTACDPYQPAELKYSLTHRILRVMRDFANPVSIVTKSPHIIRDADRGTFIVNNESQILALDCMY